MNLNSLASNFHSVNFADGTTVWFSYETPIAISQAGDITVRENVWGPTTGKHLNAVDGGDKAAKAARVSSEIFQQTLDNSVYGRA